MNHTPVARLTRFRRAMNHTPAQIFMKRPEEGFDLAEKITSFDAEVKKPFIHDLLQEIDKAMKINDNVLLATYSTRKQTYQSQKKRKWSKHHIFMEKMYRQHFRVIQLLRWK